MNINQRSPLKNHLYIISIRIDSLFKSFWGLTLVNEKKGLSLRIFFTMDKIY